jgi:hypothetical protein
MRKGLTLTLTTLAVALFAFQAYALGPKIGGVPDVYVTEKAGQTSTDDDPLRMYRYSDALVLWDYVTPSTGSASDTMYMSYALLDADIDDNVLSYDWLTDANIHYTIIGEDGGSILALNSDSPFDDLTAKLTDTDWEAQKTAQINPILGDPDLSKKLSDAGALTFQNIRLNPLPGQNPVGSPTAGRTGLPAGVWDIQQASLFVYDGSTTPAEDQILLVTLDSGTLGADYDVLTGGGPVYQMENDMSSSTPAWDVSGTSGWLTVRAGYAPNQQDLDLATGLPTAAANNTVGSLSATFGATQNTSFPNAVAVFQTLTESGTPSEGLDVTSDRVYRLTANLASSNADATDNPNARIDINGRQSVGEVFGEITSKTNAAEISIAPTAGSPVAMPPAMLWPRGDGHIEFLVALWDTSNDTLGTLTISGMQAKSFEHDKLVGGDSVSSEDQFIIDLVANAATSTADWFFAAAPLTGTATINATTIPAITTQTTVDSLGINGTASTNKNNGGVGFFFGQGFTTPADPKLIVVTAQARTTSGENDLIPPFHLAVQETGKNTRFGFLLDRAMSGDATPVKNNDATDLTTTATPIRVVFESAGAKEYGLEFYSILVPDAVGRAVTGTLLIDSINVDAYELPSE